MAWRIEFSSKAKKQLDRLDSTVRSRILDYLRNRIESSNNPLSLGTMLTGDFSGHVRFRIGDYRLIARCENDRMVILVIGVGHRRLVYT